MAAGVRSVLGPGNPPLGVAPKSLSSSLSQDPRALPLFSGHDDLMTVVRGMQEAPRTNASTSAKMLGFAKLYAPVSGPPTRPVTAGGPNSVTMRPWARIDFLDPTLTIISSFDGCMHRFLAGRPAS